MPNATVAGIAACAGLLLAPAAAMPEVRTGSLTDPTGDAAAPQRDITAVEFAYDTQGGATAKVTTAAAPGPSTTTQLAFGLGRGGEGCPERSMAAQVTVPSGAANALIRPPDQALAPPAMAIQGATVTILQTDARMANQPWDCAVVLSADAGGVLGDSTDAIPLKASAAPPPGARPPATRPPASKPKPSAKQLRRAIRSCQRKHRGSKRSSKRARNRCIARARKKYRARP